MEILQDRARFKINVRLRIPGIALKIRPISRMILSNEKIGIQVSDGGETVSESFTLPVSETHAGAVATAWQGGLPCSFLGYRLLHQPRSLKSAFEIFPYLRHSLNIYLFGTSLNSCPPFADHPPVFRLTPAPNAMHFSI